MTRQALAVGFTLDELTPILKVFDRGGAPCQHVRGLAASKLAQIETRVEEMIRLRDDLRDALQDWDRRLAKTASGQRATSRSRCWFTRRPFWEAKTCRDLKRKLPTNEALMAYRLQKQGLTPKQIREQIITQFSEQ